MGVRGRESVIVSQERYDVEALWPERSAYLAPMLDHSWSGDNLWSVASPPLSPKPRNIT